MRPIDASVQALLAVSAGGAIGSAARYATTLGAARWLGTAFPWGTLAVNVVGSFVVALVLEAVLLGSSISPNTRLALTTGFCGGFTTYSTFNYEVLRLVEEGTPLKAATYLATTLVTCAAFGFLGLLAARALAR